MTGPVDGSEGPSAGDDGPWCVEVPVASEAMTRAVARAIAGVCRAGDLLLLVGDLGAGKTVFAKGFAAGLGVSEPVTSPTFTLVQQYSVDRGPVRELVHADVYRLSTAEEMDDLAIGELIEDGAVGLVEWGDRATAVLGPEHLRVEIVPASATGGGGGVPGADPGEHRLLRLAGRGSSWADRRRAVEDAIATAVPDHVAGLARGTAPEGG